MRGRIKSRWLIGAGIALVVGVWIFREPLRNRISQSATLANPAPPPDLVGEMIERATDRPAAIMAAWNTGKIIHREVAAREIGNSFPPSQPLPAELEAIVLAGALDADVNVRDIALGILRNRQHPALGALVVAQLHDCDPQTRLVGLNYLKQFDAGFGVPAVIPLLDEEDPLIIATALKLLEHWTDQKFDIKLAESSPRENEKTGLIEYPEGSQAKAMTAARRAKSWWREHGGEFHPATLPAARPEPKLARAADFSLRTLDGRQVRLADLRGKVVLINFWTTWCTACVAEMPELIALQKQHGDRLAIIGVSLDFVPDEHGHLGGHPAVEEQSLPHAEEDSHEHNHAALLKVREKVARTIQTRGINYPILLDEANEIGGRFNGGELPTTVIIDADGNLRRRFVGARSLPVFEAMIAEAGRPATALSPR